LEAGSGESADQNGEWVKIEPRNMGTAEIGDETINIWGEARELGLDAEK